MSYFDCFLPFKVLILIKWELNVEMIINMKEISPGTTPLTRSVLVEMTRFTVVREGGESGIGRKAPDAPLSPH